MLIACFGHPSAAEPPIDPGAEFEESLETFRDQFDRKLGELTARKLTELEAQQNERQAMQLGRGYAMQAARHSEAFAPRPSRSSSGDTLGAVAKRAP